MKLLTAVLLGLSLTARGADTAAVYFWKVAPIGDTAQLATLSCHGCNDGSDNGSDIPLLAAIRDTLSDHNPHTDRITSVWLLTYSRPNIPQRLLSAIPFFYWRVGKASPKSAAAGTEPLLDLTSLQHPMIHSVERDVLQWTMLDPSFMPIRATSRAFRTNEVDHERLHIEEAISYLREAPSGNSSATLTASQIDTLIARLELRKTLLGGFVSERAAARIGAEESFKYERIRSRNWELLRQCADKTGLYFEPVEIAGTSNEYAMVWFPLEESAQPEGTRSGPVWKVLNVKNPWNDSRLKTAKNVAYIRDLDENGNLLPFGVTGVRQVRLLPLSVYSLSYPKMPLLLVDFRNRIRMKWHEMTQRSINEVTAGVIGISHFTNWYYYVAADLYDFVESRRGGATNQADRLDSYSQFRVKLQLDKQLDPRLRQDMRQRIDTLAVNPLESAPQNEMAAAAQRFEVLQQQAVSGRLLARVEKSRRLELALDKETKKEVLRDYVLHAGSLGFYTHRAKPSSQNLARIEGYRRAQYELALLDTISDGGTPPEVAYDVAKIESAVQNLKQLMPEIRSREMHAHVIATLQRVRNLSQDEALKSDCSTVLASLELPPPFRDNRIALKPSAVDTDSPDHEHNPVAVDGFE